MAFHSCKNCDHPFGTSYKYCPNCGLNQAETLTLKTLFNNTIQNYFAFDARFFKSFIPLLIKPGFLPTEFVKGKRLTYLHPAQLYLFSTILFFFLFSFQVNKSADVLNTSLAESFNQNLGKLSEVEMEAERVKDSLNKIEIRNALENNNSILTLSEKEIDSLVNEKSTSKPLNFNLDFDEAKVDSLIAINATDNTIYKEMGLKDDAGFFNKQLYKQALKFYKNPKAGSVYKQFMESIPITLFFLLPIFAFLLKLFYNKTKTYVNHLVFSFYYFAFLFFVFTILIVLNYSFNIPSYINLIIILSCFVYLVIAIKKYYNKTWVGTVLKSMFLTLTYFIFVIPVAFIITLIISFLFY